MDLRNSVNILFNGYAVYPLRLNGSIVETIFITGGHLCSKLQQQEPTWLLAIACMVDCTPMPTGMPLYVREHKLVGKSGGHVTSEVSSKN